MTTATDKYAAARLCYELGRKAWQQLGAVAAYHLWRLATERQKEAAHASASLRTE